MLIRRGRLAWEPERTADLLIKEGKVAALGDGLEAPGVPELDAGGLVLAPGLVDMHVHLRQPGFEYKETIETGCAAAARGGVTTLACMPNTSPVIDTPELVDFVRQQASQACGVRVLPLAAVSK
ncbi:MAG: amidohydrolase family protein, partial [Oscillospiraceae bacterium]|nr:amidohydrolase family protein [Oscillospiraceae bacterium]